MRLEGGHGRSKELAAAVEVLEVKLEFDQPGVPGAIITSAIEAFRRRRSA